MDSKADLMNTNAWYRRTKTFGISNGSFRFAQQNIMTLPVELNTGVPSTFRRKH